MPRKAKENKEIIEEKPKKVKTTKSSTKTDDKKANNSKKTTTKKSVESKKETKVTTKKKTTSTKKSTSKSKTAKKKVEPKNAVIEYYDLPAKYNQTVVKLLAQTPKTLFVYWEISDEDINKYKKQYGDNFFETTKPVLIIHNDTLNYSFEVEINDFANSWYLHVNDSKSNYRIELGRRPLEQNNSNYIYITSSNGLESPNDHILFNTSLDNVYFKNVKTNKKFSKNLANLSFITNMGKIYNIYDLYKELYKNEDNLDALSNPSSSTSR